MRVRSASFSFAVLPLVLLPLPALAAGTAPAKPEVTIVNLYDAFGKDLKGTTQDFGFAALITYGGKTILFDSGSNAELFKKNVAALGVDLKKVDFAIASHDHFDHVNGFDYALTVNPKLKIYYPNDRWAGAPTTYDLTGRNPDVAKTLPVDEQYFGGKQSGTIPLKSSGRFWKANVEFVAESKEIMPGVTLIATTSPLIGHTTRYPGTITDPSRDPVYEDKFEGLPELSLSLKTAKGEVLVVGCSHSAIDMIVLETKAFVKRDIDAVAGGLHLIPYDATYITAEAKRMKDTYGIKRVAPAHCTGHLAFKILRDAYKENYFPFGLGAKLEW